MFRTSKLVLFTEAGILPGRRIKLNIAVVTYEYDTIKIRVTYDSRTNKKRNYNTA